MSNNKTTKGNYHVRIYLRDIFGFADYQNNCSYGLGYKLKLQRNSDNHVLSHRAGFNAENLALGGRVVIEGLSWTVPHYTPNLLNQKLMLGHIVSKAPTDLSFIRRSVYLKVVATENNWTFELGVGHDIEISIYVKVG